MGKNVITIPASISRITAVPLGTKQKRKVAAYARVSTDHEEQLTSYEAQVDYYTKYIKNRDDWTFVNVYTDEGVTGCNTAHREGFKKMVDDALAGKIDLIITKSVSRFARNTVDSLTTIRKLKDNKVECYFEKENIWTFDSKGELLLTIMSSLAQEESRSISENCTWGQRKRFQDGKVSVPYKRFLGYDRGEDGNLVVNKEQAKIVRRIYGMFLQGKSPYTIAKQLTNEGIPTPGGKTTWAGSVVRSILSNEKYKGDALLQKVFTVSFLTKEKQKNEGQVPQYYVEGNHEAIIEPAIFDMVQGLLKAPKIPGTHQSNSGFLSGKIKCGCCGGYYGSKVWHSNDKYRKVVWRCNNKYDGEMCDTPKLEEEQVKGLFLKAFNRLCEMRESVTEDFNEIKDQLFDATELVAEQSQLQIEINDLTEAVEKCIQRNAHQALYQEEYKKHYDSLVEQYENVRARLQTVSDEIIQKRTKKKAIEIFLEELNNQSETITEFSENLWFNMVDHMTVYSKDDIRFTFKDGTEIAAN
nr:MAG TPA: integrase [Caudoviricetes sp.]